MNEANKAVTGACTAKREPRSNEGNAPREPELRQVLKHGSAGNENHIRAALAQWEGGAQ